MFKNFFQKTDLLPFLIVLFFSIFVTYNQVGNGIINYVDHKFPFFFSNLLTNQFYTWNDYIYLGFNQSTSLTLNLPYTFLFTLIERVVNSYIFVNRIEYALAVFCNIYFSYLFLSVIFKNNLGLKQKLAVLLASTFFTTNMLNTSLFYMGLSQQIFSFSFISLYLYSFIRLYKHKRLIFFVPLLLSLVFIGSFNYPYALIALLVVTIIILSFGFLTTRQKLISISVTIVLWILLNFYWLLPMFFSIFVSPSYNFSETISDIGEIEYIMRLTSERYTLDHLLKLTPNLEIISKLNKEESSYIYYFLLEPILILSFCATGLLIFAYIIKKDTKTDLHINTKPLAVVFIIGVFLAKGLNYPYGNIYQSLFESNVFFRMFRDSQKWMEIVYFILMILISNMLVARNKLLIKLFFLIFLLVYLYPWVNDGLMGRFRAYSVPEYYFTFYDYYNRDIFRTYKRALILDSKVGYTSYAFDTNLLPISSNIIKFISPIPIVDLFSNGGGNSFTYLLKTFSMIQGNDSDIEVFQRLGVTHVFHQKDLVKSSLYDYSSSYFDKVEFDKIDIYQLKKEFVTPHILLSSDKENSIVKFQKVSPVQYEIEVNGDISNSSLILLYTFDKNWKLYPHQNYKEVSCVDNNFYKVNKENNIFNLTPHTVLECEASVSNQNPNVDFLFINLIHSLSPTQYFDYANKWDLSVLGYKDVVDSNNRYRFTLFYMPQLYFYFGLFIFFITIVSVLFVTVFLRFKISKSRKELSTY